MSVERYSGALSIQTLENYFENQKKKKKKSAEKQDSAETRYKIQNNIFKTLT